MRALFVATVATLVAGVAAILAGTPALAEPEGIVVKRDISYGPLPEQTLTTCVPGEKAALGKADDVKPRAGVVLIHGGAWIAFDKNSLMPVCEALARDGLFAATIDYRLARKNVISTRWPAQLADTQLAVRWLRANAVSLGLDGSRLCAYGESAGAHLAVFLAAKKTIEPSDMASRLAEQPVSVVCAVDNFGPVDLTEPGASLRDTVQLLLGKPLRSATLAAFRGASPLFLVGRDTAPIFIEHAVGDSVVEVMQSFKLFAALTNAKVQARFTMYRGGHQWKNVPGPEQGFLAAEERQFLRLFLADAPHLP